MECRKRKAPYGDNTDRGKNYKDATPDDFAFIDEVEAEWRKLRTI